MSAGGLSLQTQGLGVRFGGYQAVADVSLVIEPGARRALIGPNGAGKTTLINLLTGELRPSAGTISLQGRDITALSVDERVRLGIVRTFQVNQLFPTLTPLESMMLAVAEREGLAGSCWRRLSQLDAQQQEAVALLERFFLGDCLDLRVSTLPYGKQRLLEIALAMACRPRILLLDEPAAGVPAGESGELFEAIHQLPADVAILFIEHDMDLVFRFAETISVLVAGSILVEGSPAEIARHEAVRRVYLGSTAQVLHG